MNLRYGVGWCDPWNLRIMGSGAAEKIQKMTDHASRYIKIQNGRFTDKTTLLQVRKDTFFSSYFVCEAPSKKRSGERVRLLAVLRVSEAPRTSEKA